jgi:DNA repair exonuclease SbcCD ATPase subunit/DNA repair exonuclease SbcCD nuclease subunit
MFSDIHFQAKGLARIVETGSWIISEFERQRVDHVVCLGDVLNTREEVDVAAQSAAVDFFRLLAERFPVELILGNHDMNLKHARRVSSLDALAMHPRIRLHREIAAVRLGEQPSLMIPYHEDQSTVVAAVQGMAAKNPAVVASMVAYGHLGVNGAVQITRFGTRFTGAVGPDSFAALKRTFTGHFHVHQELSHRVCYIGSPLQFNFGDAGDARGIVVFDQEADSYQHIVNPRHDAFRIVTAQDAKLAVAFGDREAYRDTFVTVVYDDVVTAEEHELLCTGLRAIGVIDVKKESVVERSIREQDVEVIGGAPSARVADLVDPFVAATLPADSVLKREDVVAFGRDIVERINAQGQDVADTGRVFVADPPLLIAQNFMGVQARLELDFTSLPDGLWFCEGRVGAGKSTILEAFCWCLYGKFIRDKMAADDAINETAGQDCRVELRFPNGWSIVRFRKYVAKETDAVGTTVPYEGNGAKVFKDGIYQADFEKGDARATQAKIDELLGADHEAFSKGVVLGQNAATNFISAGDEARRSIIESFLGLERFDLYLEEVRAQKAQLAKEAETQLEVQRLKGAELVRINENVRSIEAQVLDARNEHQHKLDEAAGKISELEQALKAAEAGIDVAKAEGANLVAQAKERLAAATAAQDALQATLAAKAKGDAVSERASLIERDQLAPALALAASLESETQRLTVAVKWSRENLVDATAQLAALKPIDPAAVQDRKDRAAAAQGAVTFAQAAKGTAEATFQAAMAKVSAVKPELARLTELAATGAKGEHCPTCRQVLDAPALSALLDQVRAQAAELIKEGTEASATAKTWAARIVELEAALAAVSGPTDADVAVQEVARARWQAEIKRHTDQLARETAALDNVADPFNQRAQAIVGDPTGLMGVQQVIDAIRTEVVELRRQAAAHLKGYDPAAWTAAAQAVQAANDAVQAASIQANAILSLATTKASGCRTDLAFYRGAVERLYGQDPAAGLLATKESLQAQWRTVSEEVEGSKRIASEIAQKQGYVTFWDRAFAAKGAMRAFMLEDSVRVLNSIIAGYMGTIALQGHAISFKSDLTVVERYGRRSGGQRKAADISVLLGMREVIQQRSRFKAGFLFLDEVFEGMDADHRQAVGQLMQVLAKRYRKVMVITHAPLAGVSMAGSIRAELTMLGTTLTAKAT